jgi:hypothetical protein
MKIVTGKGLNSFSDDDDTTMEGVLFQPAEQVSSAICICGIIQACIHGFYLLLVPKK